MNNAIPVICSFESRRCDEMRSLIEKFGGEAVSAPSMREVPIEENRDATDAIHKLTDGQCDFLVLLTGVGLEQTIKLAAAIGCQDALLDALKRIPLFIRGPKPGAVLHKLGIKPALKAAEPNTWKELVAAIDGSEFDVNGTAVGIQEYGMPNPELNDALTKRGASVIAIPVYRWALPIDLNPLRSAISQTIDGSHEILMFTSAQQVRHVLQVATQSDRRTEWLDATKNTVVASIGPTCTAALLDHGLSVDVEASPPKMGPLVRSAVEYFQRTDR